jgi:hypothetical protein
MWTPVGNLARPPASVPAGGRRSDAARCMDADAGENAPRSRHHLVYVALETMKVVVLAALGATALAAPSSESAA